MICSPLHFFKTVECSPLDEGVNISPRGQISPLGARGEVKNVPQGRNFVPMLLALGVFCSHRRKNLFIKLPSRGLLLKMHDQTLSSGKCPSYVHMLQTEPGS
jgi:hypothetical protein